MTEAFPRSPPQCLVIEDTPASLSAGQVAGMQVLAVTTSYPALSLLSAPWIADFRQTRLFVTAEKLAWPGTTAVSLSYDVANEEENMFCDGCGAQVEPGQSFCPRCGKALGPAPFAPVQCRTAGHLRLLGILWLAISAFRLLPGLALLFIFRPDMQWLPPEVPAFVPHLVQMIGLVFISIAALGVAVGWGLLKRQSWARMAALVFGAVSLLDVPFGTALGIYTLWVLLSAGAEEEYRQISQAA